MSDYVEGWSYSLILRAIGQSLEEHRVQDFFLLKWHNEDFVVRGHSAAPVELSWIYKLIGQPVTHTKRSLELHYSLTSILQLQNRGVTLRKNPDNIPDYYLLSQTLRTVGRVIDKRALRLQSLERKGETVCLEFQERTGQIRVEEHAINSFENYFLHTLLPRVHKRRAA